MIPALYTTWTMFPGNDDIQAQEPRHRVTEGFHSVPVHGSCVSCLAFLIVLLLVPSAEWSCEHSPDPDFLPCFVRLHAGKFLKCVSKERDLESQ